MNGTWQNIMISLTDSALYDADVTAWDNMTRLEIYRSGLYTVPRADVNKKILIRNLRLVRIKDHVEEPWGDHNDCSTEIAHSLNGNVEYDYWNQWGLGARIWNIVKADASFDLSCAVSPYTSEFTSEYRLAVRVWLEDAKYVW